MAESAQTPAASAAKKVDIPSISKRIIANLEQVVIGKRPQIVKVLISWFCEGHLLLEDVPGVAKTIMARAFARSVGCSFKRIQCTPDLLPTDVTGGSIFNQQSGQFEFRPGPIFSQILLVDEINRTTPRTQAALLEAMAEGSVTIDGTTHGLKPPFLLIATQNPIEYEGTFPLPEAQLDRFLFKLRLGYPSQEEESHLLEILHKEHPLDRLGPVVTAEQLSACQRAVRQVYVDQKIRQYITRIVHGTRAHEDLSLGGSPRASIALYRTSQAVAAIRGRNYVEPEDVKHVVPSVLAHRLILHPESRLRQVNASEVLTEVMDETPAPVIGG